jgi:hypothetical protein
VADADCTTVLAAAASKRLDDAARTSLCGVAAPSTALQMLRVEPRLLAGPHLSA